MEMYTLFIGAALLSSGTAFSQTPPVAGGGCAPGTHTFCVINTSDDATTTGPVGSLRRALSDATALGQSGDATIGFDITNPASGPYTITLNANQLPVINYFSSLTSLTIDGYSQPGSALNTNTPDQGGLNTRLMIEIVGQNYGIDAGGNPLTLTIQGLDLHWFGTAIQDGPGQLNVYGCFIGTKIDGTALPGQGNSLGIRDDNGSAQIGGIEPWQRNLISGNTYDSGIRVLPAAGNTVVIEGNLIGTDVTGTLPIRNATGILVQANAPSASMRIGCTSAGGGCRASTASRNVISGNSTPGSFGFGITLEPAGTGPNYAGWEIKGNAIGSDWSGTQPLPNGAGSTTVQYGGGIEVRSQSPSDPSSLIIGGFGAGEANLIAFNAGAGIESSAYGPYEIGNFDSQGNKVHDNSGPGRTNITLYPANALNTAQPPANDPGDADTGSNGLQNYPEIQSAHVSGGQLTVTYSVDSTTGNSTYPLRIDFSVDVSEGSGEFLVSDMYPATSAQQMRTVTLPLPADAQAPVGFVATATTANHYTSEFSPSYVFDRIFADGFEPPR